MIQEQIYQLKIASIIEANKTGIQPDGLVDLSETIYQWLTKEQQEVEAKLAAQKTAALSIVQKTVE